MAPAATLSEVLVPSRSAARDTALVVGGAALTALCAQVTIPWQPVPFTLQTLSVYLVGLTLGGRKGLLSMGLYLLLGALGFPVFAQGASGAHVLFGATGGYLIGFMVAVALLGYLAEQGWDRSIAKTVAAMLAAEAIVLGLGSLWLAPFVGGYASAFKSGVAPFLVPEVLKLAVVCLGLPAMWFRLGKRSEQF